MKTRRCAVCGQKLPENFGTTWHVENGKWVRRDFCHPDEGPSCYVAQEVDS